MLQLSPFDGFLETLLLPLRYIIYLCIWSQKLETTLLTLGRTAHSSPLFWPPLQTKIPLPFSNLIRYLLPFLTCPLLPVVVANLLSLFPPNLCPSPMLSCLSPASLSAMRMLLISVVHYLVHFLVSHSQLLTSRALISLLSSAPHSTIFPINHGVSVNYYKIYTPTLGKNNNYHRLPHKQYDQSFLQVQYFCKSKTLFLHLGALYCPLNLFSHPQ